MAHATVSALPALELNALRPFVSNTSLLMHIVDSSPIIYNYNIIIAIAIDNQTAHRKHQSYLARL